VKSRLLEVRSPSNIAVKSCVAAVDHRVAWMEQRRHGLNSLLCWCSGWNHNPGRAWGWSRPTRVSERGGAGAINAFGLLNQIRRSIVDHDPMSVTLQFGEHIHPHFPKANEPDFHSRFFS
jgi:hypothetical protein